MRISTLRTENLLGLWAVLCDFCRDFEIKKETTRGKAVMERKEKARQKQMKVNLSEIKQDPKPQQGSFAYTPGSSGEPSKK